MAVTGAILLFVAVKDTIFPVPLGANPIDGVLLVQLYTVPATPPEKLTADVGELLQSNWFKIELTVGIGFTVITAELFATTELLQPEDFKFLIVIVVTPLFDNDIADTVIIPVPPDTFIEVVSPEAAFGALKS